MEAEFILDGYCPLRSSFFCVRKVCTKIVTLVDHIFFKVLNGSIGATQFREPAKWSLGGPFMGENAH